MKFDDNDPVRFTRSISEYARQSEELMNTRNVTPTRVDLIESYKGFVKIAEDLTNAKGIKEAAIRKIRELERRYPDIFTSTYPAYNGRPGRIDVV